MSDPTKHSPLAEEYDDADYSDQEEDYEINGKVQ